MLQVPPIASTHNPFATVTINDLCPIDFQKRSTLLEKVWRAFVKIIKKFLRQYSLVQEPAPFDLSYRQIHLIRQACEVRKRSDSLTGSAARSEIQTEPVEPVPVSDVVTHDPSLEKLKEFFLSFAQIAVNECTFEDVIAPCFEEWKAKLDELVKSIPEWNETLISLKESLAPLMKSVKKADDPAITLIFQQLLKYYVQSDKETVKAELLESLKDQKKAGNIDHVRFQAAVDYLDPILMWLYHPSNWMVRSTHPVNFHHFISDSFRFLDTLSGQISNGSLNNFLRKILDFVSDEDFEDQIKEIFELNTKPITQLMGNRIADIIEHLPYSETYSLILKKIVLQMEGWIAADQARSEQEKLVEDAVKANKAHATNVREIERQRAAQQLLDLVSADGSKENYLHNEFLRAFSQHRSCHELLKKIIDADSAELSEKMRHQIYKEVVESLFPVFLPNKKRVLPHGLEIDVNGISEIIAQLSFPEKVEVLKSEAMDEFEKILQMSKVKDKDNFRIYFFALLHIIAVETSHKKIKNLLAEGLEKLITRLSTKEYLDYLASEYIFPSLISKILEGFVRTHINRNSSEMAKAYHEVFENDLDMNKDSLPLLNLLYEDIQKQLIDFDMEEAGIDFEEFKAIVHPVLLEIYDFIVDKKAELEIESLTPRQVKGFFSDYLKAESVQVNSDYGKLIMHSLFKVGSFGGWFSEKLIGWFQGTLSEVTSQTLHPISKNYTLLIDSIVETASITLLSADSIRENLFADELSKEEMDRQREKVQRDFPVQIRRISALAHDTIYRSLEARTEPWIQHFTPTTAKISTVIQNVFNRILGDEKLNESLFLSSLDIIKASLEQSDKKIIAELTDLGEEPE